MRLINKLLNKYKQECYGLIITCYVNSLKYKVSCKKINGLHDISIKLAKTILNHIQEINYNG